MRCSLPAVSLYPCFDLFRTQVALLHACSSQRSVSAYAAVCAREVQLHWCLRGSVLEPSPDDSHKYFCSHSHPHRELVKEI